MGGSCMKFRQEIMCPKKLIDPFLLSSDLGHQSLVSRSRDKFALSASEINTYDKLAIVKKKQSFIQYNKRIPVKIAV